MLQHNAHVFLVSRNAPEKVCSAVKGTRLFLFSAGTAGSTSTTGGGGEEEAAAHSRAQPEGCGGGRLAAAVVSPGCGRPNRVLHAAPAGRILRPKMPRKGRGWRSCGFVGLAVSGAGPFPEPSIHCRVECSSSASWRCRGVPGPRVRTLLSHPPLGAPLSQQLGFPPR